MSPTLYEMRAGSPGPLIATYSNGPAGTVSGSDLVIQRPMDVNDVIRPLAGLLSKMDPRPDRDSST